MLVSEPTIPIERKGLDLKTVRSCIHLILASNNQWIVPAGVDERRFLVLDVSPVHAQDGAYFEALINQMDKGGRAAMLYDLLHFDLKTVNLRKVPATAALRGRSTSRSKPRSDGGSTGCNPARCFQS